MLIQFGEPTPPSSMKDASLDGLAIGIDLGTTHSVIAIYQDGCPVALKSSLSGLPEGTIIPSVVVYENNKVIVGHDALPHANAIKSIKRLMGQTQLSSQTSSITPSPIEISSEILKALKQEAEQILSQKITKAVITVPAYFDEAARQETKQAAELAGLQVLRLLNEPTAAALAYGLDKGVEGTYAVYDFGGGTFDISIIRFTKGVFQVIATAGDTQLGGDDLDEAIIRHLSITYPGKFIPQTLGRKFKEALSHQEKIEEETFSLTKDQLKTIVDPFLEKTLQISANALSDAQITFEELDGIVLVGGSTKMPLVRQKVTEYFKQTPLTNINPDEVVALGAAIQAHNLTYGSDTLLLDVTPLSLGLETMGGLVEKIIHRNSPIPVAIAQEFTTYQDGQTGMDIHVLQGEREFVKDCRSLAKFTLQGIPPLPAGIARVRVTFRLDVDGLLTVSAREETTGIEQKIEIKPSYGLSEADLLKILRDNYEQGADDINHRLLVEEQVHAQQFLKMLEKALKDDGDLLTEEEQKNIKTEIIVLENLLNSSEKDVIKTQVKTLERMSQPFAEKRMSRSLTRALAGKQI